MTVRAKFLLGFTFLVGIGVGLLLQSCVVGYVAIPTDGVTVGGGITGRWKGSVTPTISSFGTGELILVFIEDSEGNISGSLFIGLREGEGCPTAIGGARAILGKAVGTQISFFSDTIRFTGALQDINHMSGSFDGPCNKPGSENSGIWSVTRVPPP